MDTLNLSILLVILMVGLFDFNNGFHDAADMVATAIASHLMSPAIAIAIVSIFTFIAPFVVGLTKAAQPHMFREIGPYIEKVNHTHLVVLNRCGKKQW